MSKKPTLYGYGEKFRGRGRDPVLVRVAAAWPHEKGKGFTVEFDSLPLNFHSSGRIVFLEADKPDDQDSNTPEFDQEVPR